MTYAGADFMPLDRQLFPRDLAAAVAELARQKYRTAKQLARAWRCDPSTAENLFKGHLGLPLLMKAVAAEGGEFWDRLGEEITGETYEQRQERKLRAIIKEAADARQNLLLLRTRAALLDERAGQLDGAVGRPLDEPERAGVGGHRQPADGSRERQARCDRDAETRRSA